MIAEKNNTQTFAPVSFTENALKELQKLSKDQLIGENTGVRVGVKGGGCSGMTYVLGFDKHQEGDEIFQINELTFYLNKAHALYLIGMQVDHQDGLNARGFTFSNPNASSSCGCGTSFAV